MRMLAAACGAGAGLALATLALVFAWHIAVGAKTIPRPTVFVALSDRDPTVFDHVVILDLRLPRALFAIVVGAALAVAEALMQGVTCNPPAEAGLLGRLAGASLAVVLVIGDFDLAAPGWLPLVAAAGAPAAASMVWLIAVAAPLTLVLSGAAVTAFLGALIAVMNPIDEDRFETLRVWLTGRFAGRSTEVMLWTLPWLLAGMAVALATARQVTALAMGEETATGLGVDVGWLKGLVIFSVVALIAAAVAIAGPMGFVGLVVRHAVRLPAGYDYRLIVPYSARRRREIPSAGRYRRCARAGQRCASS